MDSKDVQIIAQNAGTSAANVYAALLSAGHVDCWDTQLFERVRGDLFYGVLNLVEAEGTKALQEAFPGAVEAPYGNVVPFPATAAPPPQQASYTQQASSAAPQQAYAPPPPPPAPVVVHPTQPVAGAAPGCPACGGEMWDNRADNQRRRANRNKLGADLKCKAQGSVKGHVIWPEDFEAYKNFPQEPRS